MEKSSAGYCSAIYGCSVDYLFVDNAAMQIILNPKQFDVILTENMFGDILSDEASVISGSLGLFPSASVGKGRRCLNLSMVHIPGCRKRYCKPIRINFICSHDA